MPKTPKRDIREDIELSKETPRARPKGARRLRRRSGALAPIRRPQTVPAELAGRWIAWSPDRLRILGHGATISEAKASAGNLLGLVVSWIPPLDELRPAPNGKMVGA
jgi:hypothetical protein